MRWNDVAFAFEVDGSLQDIYAYDTTIAHWDILLRLSNEISQVAYECDGKNITLPSSTDALLDDRTRTHCLKIDLGGPIANAHFFTAEEIELDLDPRQIRSQIDLDAVLNFCSRLSHEIKRDVMITAENTLDIVFLFHSVSEKIWRVPRSP